jgi:hypothetical protein
LPASAIIASVWDPTDRYAMRVLIGQPFHRALPSARRADALRSTDQLPPVDLDTSDAWWDEHAPSPAQRST